MTQASVGFHCPECLKRQGQRVVTAQSLRPLGRPPVTIALIGISVVVFIIQMVTGSGNVDDSEFTYDYLLYGPWVESGDVWLIVTSAFLHGDPIHLGFNMFLLWIIGKGSEHQIGRVQFILIYFSAMFAAAAFVLAFNYLTPTLGASGAVLGMFGGVAGLMVMRGRRIQEIPGFQLIVLNLFLPLVIPGISFWGHLGGVVGGFVAGVMIASLSDKARMPAPVTYLAVSAVVVVWFGVAVYVGSVGGLR